ncbi:hypothetical protein [Echinimonas agarilytica]|uniref:Uncharacterized protein n=1 Tax=Echinimonas agarilytica TaxID=1215918 RepID=A0AA41W7K7_9GAMM|nr:hypothetical protein [Echinimonas agarilytica]MCM2680102.1 hypothetical protein [Echinimonas agarilytica]
MKIVISVADLPFIRFIKRNQLFTACLRRITEHPDLARLEHGGMAELKVECDVSETEYQRVSAMTEWWEKAEYQGISTRLLNRMFALRTPTPAV